MVRMGMLAALGGLSLAASGQQVNDKKTPVAYKHFGHCQFVPDGAGHSRGQRYLEIRRGGSSNTFCYSQCDKIV